MVCTIIPKGVTKGLPTYLFTILTYLPLGYYNAQMHNTKKFETVKPDSTSDLIVRRGQNVYLAVKLAQPLDPKFSQLYLRVM